MSNTPATTEPGAAVERQQPEQDALAVLGSQLKQHAAIFATLLGVDADSKDAHQFRASAYSLCRSKPRLLKCERQSLLLAFAEVAELGLSLNPRLGEAYLIPRWNKTIRREVVNVQTGYHGLLKIVNRGPGIDSIHVDVVRKGDKWIERGGTDPCIVHERPLEGVDESDEGILAAYAVVWVRGSARPYTAVVRRPKILEAADMSGDKDGWSNTWTNHFTAMARKTALRRVANIVPGCSDTIEAVKVEDARAAGENVTLARVAEMFSEMTRQPAMPEGSLASRVLGPSVDGDQNEAPEGEGQP